MKWYREYEYHYKICALSQVELEVCREDIHHVISMSAKLLPMHAHNYCILHRLNICGMQCTSYYIGYLHYDIKAGCRDGRSKGSCTFQLKVLLPACHTPPGGCQQYLLTKLPS